MTVVTGTPLNELTILDVDASQPGTLTITLAEKIKCENCGHTGARWQVSLAPTPTTTTTSPGPTTPKPRKMREADPGG